MQVKKLKYNGSGTHERAILHMIGQSEDVFKSKPSTAEIAAWMNVGKATARKHLNAMVEDGKLIKTKVFYRQPDVYKDTWSLHPDVMIHYEFNGLKTDYELYAQRVLQVILT